MSERSVRRSYRRSYTRSVRKQKITGCHPLTKIEQNKYKKPERNKSKKRL